MVVRNGTSRPCPTNLRPPQQSVLPSRSRLRTHPRSTATWWSVCSAAPAPQRSMPWMHCGVPKSASPRISGYRPTAAERGKLQRHASTSLRQRAVTQESAWAGLRYCGGAGYPHTPYPCAPCPWLAALHCTAWRSLHLPLSLPPAWTRCAAPCAARATSAPSPPVWHRKAVGAWAPISLPTRWPPSPKPSAASPACARVALQGSSRGQPP